MSRIVRARVWPTHGLSTAYPEQTHRALTPPRSTGVCFSGGSTRSYAATVGQLRGLTEAGLMSRVGYISAVSAGAWAATAYSYYPEGEGVSSDSTILGEPAAPEQLSLTQLSRIDPRSLGYAATGDFAEAFESARADRSLAPDEVWTRAVAQTFLRPYGLFDPGHPVSFTLDDETAREIRARNPVLGDVAFHTVRREAHRPYLLIHSALNWPEDEPDLSRVNVVGFEYSPLAVGSPSRLILQYEERPPRLVGGGFVEPFAFGSAAPREPIDSDGLVTLEPPPRLFTLADAVGACSAFSTPDRDLRTYPHADHWPVDPPEADSGPTTTHEVFSDGGDIDNYGLIALLRRRVKAIIVFVNTGWPLSLEFDPVRWPVDRSQSVPARCEIDPFLAPLFGAPSARFSHNHVFSEADFPALISGLQTAKRRGDPVMTTTTHIVQPNNWWGIEGGGEVRICWVYNEYVGQWVERLPEPLRQLVRDGASAEASGPFARFPHYLTRGHNPGTLIRLTPPQVNLLAHLSCWNIVEYAALLRGVLDVS